MIKNNFKSQKFIVFVVMAIILLLVVFSCVSSNVNRSVFSYLTNKDIVFSKNKLVVHFISVGEADAMAINFPNGEVALIDTGLADTSADVISYIRTFVTSRNKDNIIDYLFLTHADSDHTGGASNIVDNFKIKKVIRSRQYADFESLGICGQTVESKSYASLISKIKSSVGEENLIVAKDNSYIELGDAYIHMLYPMVEYDESNDYSYYMKVCYKGKSILFSGDATSVAEEQMLAYHYESLDADIYKVSHHGSNSSNCQELLNAVTPKFSIISCGKNNFGHPSSEVLKRLTQLNSKVYTTENKGNIIAVVDNDIKFYFNVFYITSFGFNNLLIESMIMIVLIAIFFIDIIKLAKQKANN